MSNTIKYSTQTENNTLKKGNFVIGVNDVDYGPTSETGYYNTITPPEGGYVVYKNRGDNERSIYVAESDEELVLLKDDFGATGTTANDVLVWAAQQDDVLILNNPLNNIVTDGLILYLDADSICSYPKDNTTWYDLSGNEKNGSLVNGTTWNLNGYMTTDGINDRIDVVRPWTPNLATDYYTIEVWFSPNALPSAQFSTNSPVFGARTGSDYMILLYPAVNGESKMGVSYDDSRYASAHQSTATISSNEWVQFVHVGIPYVENGYNRGKLKYYVNGALDRDTFTSSDSNGYGIQNPFYVGHDTRWQAFSNLDMAIIRIYDRELTQEEITQNYNAQKSRFGL